VLTILKYPIEPRDINDIEMPGDAEPLTVDVQRGVICVWVVVDPKNPIVVRKFHVFGTGHPIEEKRFDALIYVGTVQQDPFVWHIFIEPEASHG
jgi:hypothetical protein